LSDVDFRYHFYRDTVSALRFAHATFDFVHLPLDLSPTGRVIRHRHQPRHTPPCHAAMTRTRAAATAPCRFVSPYSLITPAALLPDACRRHRGTRSARGVVLRLALMFAVVA